MPVGIENLATGFLQGLNARKQQERQDVIDQREAERFDMQKAQFADNQAANQLSMKTNQFQLGQAQAKAEREKILQEKEDKFRKQWEGFARPFAMGNDQEGYNALERTYNDVGYMGKGAFKRDAQGNVLLDDKGNITFLTYGADGKPTSKLLNKDQMIEGFVNSYDPLKHWEYEQKTAAEIAKEDREQKNKIQLKRVEHGFNVALEKEKGRNQRALYSIKSNQVVSGKKSSAKSESDYEPLLPLAQQFFGSRLTSKQLKSTTDQISKDEFIANGLQNFKLNNVGKFISTKDMQQAEQSLNQLADSIYGKQTVSANNQPIQTREGLITPKNLDGGGIDMSDFSLTPSGGGGNMQNSPIVAKTPQSMPVPQVVPTASYRVPTNKGYVLYDENGNAVNYVNPTPTMPIDIVNAVRDAIPDMPPPRQFPPGTTYFNPPRRMPAGQNFFSGSNPFEKK